MNRWRPGVGALVCSAIFLLTSCGSVSAYAARVDGQSVRQSELEQELRAIASNEEYLKSVEESLPGGVRGSGTGTFDAAFTARVLTNQIFYELVNREVGRRKLRVTRADLNTARPTVAEKAGGQEILRDFPREYQSTLVRRAAEINVLTGALTGQPLGDKTARAYYDANQAEFAQACVSHILVNTKEQADAIRARLAGGEDFAAVARAESKDTGSAARNGELGCNITRDTSFVPEFLQAVFTLAVGDVSQPVQTQFGFHLIKVTSRDTPPYEQVAARANQKIVEAGQAKFQEWLVGAIEGARISVNPKYGTFRKSGATSAVVPPQAPTTLGPSGTTVPGVPGPPTTRVPGQP